MEEMPVLEQTLEKPRLKEAKLFVVRNASKILAPMNTNDSNKILVSARAFPFRITFRSDSYESAASAMAEAAKNVGFKLKYTQSSTCA